ncbi:MAG: hypothetical protein JNK02_13565 [Planctomycetes bacterium]|nr:hypothetical protein [Planctomycetota bacterium]
MNRNSTTALALAGLTVLAGLGWAQSATEGRGRGRALDEGAVQGRFERSAGQRGHWLERRRELRDFARRLEFTDAQRELARARAAEIAPRARALRAEAREILAAARERARAGDREGARAEARERFRDLRQRARAEWTDAGRPLVDALTPAQRARIEERLAARGRVFDPERASRRAGRALGLPRAVERLARPGPHGPR